MTKIATITLNPAYDLIGDTNYLRTGEINDINTTGIYPAGKGINVAKVLANLGMKSLVTGFYGKENPVMFDVALKALDLENKLYPIPGITRFNITISEGDGVTTDLHFGGFGIDKETWQKFHKDSLKLLAGYDYIAICGSIPPGIKVDAYVNWLNDLQTLGARIIFDTSGIALLEGLNAKPWLIKPNQKELEEMINMKLNTTDQILEIANNINKQGIANVIVSLGEQGCLWVSNKFILQSTPPKIENVVSAVGAGDSLVAGFVYSQINNYSPEETIRLATAVSAYAVTQGNVGVDDMETINNLKNKVKVKVISGSI